MLLPDSIIDAAFVAGLDNLELALVNDKDTDPTRYVKAVYEKYELGAKTRGKDLASQFLTWIFVGSHARGGGVVRGASQFHT